MILFPDNLQGCMWNCTGYVKLQESIRCQGSKNTCWFHLDWSRPRETIISKVEIRTVPCFSCLFFRAGVDVHRKKSPKITTKQPPVVTLKKQPTFCHKKTFCQKMPSITCAHQGIENDQVRQQWNMLTFQNPKELESFFPLTNFLQCTDDCSKTY